MSTFDEVLDYVVRTTRHERYRDLCHESHVGWEDNRAAVVRLAERLLLQPGKQPRPTAPSSTLTLRSYSTSWTGYGHFASSLGKALERRGVPISFFDVGSDDRYLPGDPFLVSRLRSAGEGPSLQMSWPLSDMPGGRVAMFTMWESDRLTPAMAANLNRCAIVIVPSAWNRDGFKASGVTVPVRIANLGVSPDFKPIPWTTGDVFRVGMAARVSHGGSRKGIEDGVAAWLDAFRDDPHARLALKLWPDCLDLIQLPDDPRIEVNTRSLSIGELSRWYGSLHVLLVPSKAEGWGLHTIQAMATGRPVIACKYSGTAEFFNQEHGWELPYSVEPSRGLYEGSGNWAVPTHGGMVSALREARAAWASEQLSAIGARAIRGAKRHTWDNTAARVKGFLGQAGLLPAPVMGDAESRKKVLACPHRECRTGCQRSRCHKLEKEITWGDCVACVSTQE